MKNGNSNPMACPESENRKQRKDKIALIEIGGSHDECLYTQILYLKQAGVEVFLITRSDMSLRQVPQEEVDHHFVFPVRAGFFSQLRALWKLKRYLRDQEISKLVLNTAQGKRIRNLVFLFGKKFEYTGIIHNGKKLLGSGTQKMISRYVKKYLVLADYIRDYLEDKTPGLEISSFYAIRYRTGQITRQPDPEGDIWIVIPGPVDYKRRDYDFLIRELDNAGSLNNLKFIFLGPSETADGIFFKSKLTGTDLGKHFHFFEGFIPESTFLAYVQASHFIMPLITDQLPGYRDYKNTKISGSFNLAYGFRKPLIMHDSFSDVPEFRKTAFLVKNGNLLKTLKSLRENPDAYQAKIDSISCWESLDQQKASNSYLQFLGL